MQSWETPITHHPWAHPGFLLPSKYLWEDDQAWELASLAPGETLLSSRVPEMLEIDNESAGIEYGPVISQVLCRPKIHGHDR